MEKKGHNFFMICRGDSREDGGVRRYKDGWRKFWTIVTGDIGRGAVSGGGIQGEGKFSEKTGLRK